MADEVEAETAEPDRAEIDRLLAPIAVAQHSFITLTDVLKVGGKHDHATTRVASGRWERVGDGVYRIAGAPWTYLARVLGAVLCAGPGACVSHQCAARLLGFDFHAAAIELSVPRGRFHRPSGVTVHTSRDLDRCDIVMIDGIPVTDVARTLLDLASQFRGEAALQRSVERARRADLVTWSDLANTLASHARRGRAGVRLLRHVLVTGATTDEVTDSDAELVALSLLRERGFPEPTLQHIVRDEVGEIAASMDFAYLETLTNFEIDGPHHLTHEQRERDEARDNWLRLRGWTVRRIGWRVPFDDPNKLVRIVKDTLRAASHPSFR